jgi:subtilase family serine protease
MKKLVVCVLCSALAIAQNRVTRGTLIIPESSVERQEDAGLRAHTNVEISIPRELTSFSPSFTPGGFFETPASIACVYELVTPTTGCVPGAVTAVPTGGYGAIAVVDAYDDPNAAADLAFFSTQFGLPAAKFQVIYAKAGTSQQTSTPPSQDPSGGWEVEESVDIEMAHLAAPKAKIYLVEAASNGLGDMLPAVTLASNLVAAAGGGQVSMSWGFGDFSGENRYDGYFTTPNVVYFSSAGDSAGVNYPSSSINVISVGGTTINRNPTSGAFEQESAWYNTGGGTTPNEPRPSYQNGVASIVGTQRGTPDVALVADGRTGVWAYDTFPLNGSAGTWYILSGTSVAAPLMAGIVNLAGHKSASSNVELTQIYATRGVATDFRDIVNGNCGSYAGYLTAKGYDLCTGVGSVLGNRVGK